MNKHFRVVADESDFIVINKLTDSSFHNDKNEQGLFNIVKNELKLNELFAVHRLDKLTTGLLIFAKNHIAAQELSILFREQEIKKFYIAISGKKPKKKMGKLEGELVKSRSSSFKLIRSSNPNAKMVFQSYKYSPNRYLFLIDAITGKTHQLRVMLKSVGSPILGDKRYGSDEEKSPIYLHSAILFFRLGKKEYSYLTFPEFLIGFKGSELINLLKSYDLNKLDLTAFFTSVKLPD